MHDSDPDRFFDYYLRLIEKAVRGRVVAPGGLTPRELGAELKCAGITSEDDLDQITTLLERCIYSARFNPDDCASGAQLCEKVEGLLPDVEPTADLNASPNLIIRLQKWIPLLTRLALVILLIGAIVALASSGITFSFKGLAPVSLNTSQWTATYANEISATRTAHGSWSSMPARPSYVVCSVNPVLDPIDLDEARSPEMDLTTGVDGIYREPDDVFDPPLNSTYRLHVFPTIDTQYKFHPAFGSMNDATGTLPGAVRYYEGDIQLMLRPGQPVPLPSPTPDSVIVSYRATPAHQLSFQRDSADALSVVSQAWGRIRLRYRVATAGDYSFAPLPDVPFVPVRTSLPANVRADAQIVIDAIGELPAPTYARTVRRMHSYFAGFTVGPIDRSRIAKNTFLTVALQRRGVCRHRARAFFVVANAIGVETRLVENQRHSFCEVRLPDGSWRRMEFRLGDSEGPPSPDGFGQYVADTTPIHMIVPFFAFALLAAVMMALIGMRRNEEIKAHTIDARAMSEEMIENARHAQRVGFSWSVTIDLITLVRQRIFARLEVTPDEKTLHLEDAMEKAQIPAHMRPTMMRIVHVNTSSITPNTDDAVLDDYFWDCYRVMYFLERMDHLGGSASRP